MMRFKENNYNKMFVSVSDFIRLICGGDRLKRITSIIDDLLKKEYLKKNKRLKILDYGCGSMEISKRLETRNYIESITGSDIFNYSFKSKKLIYTNNERLFNKNEKFDVIFVVDVLHHVGINDAHKILKKLSKLSKIIIIKDHFEHGFLSRQLLRFVDFYANYGYGVNVPKKYFNENRWKETLIKSNSKEIFRKNN